MNTSNAIEVTNLQKKFGSLTAVNKVSFSIPAGSIFSLLGPNGAGKSTTISILSGLLAADGGEVVIKGHSLRAESQAARSALGVVPQEIALYPDLSARENLVFWGKMYGLRGARLASRVQ
ncbi:MAG TPA: ATP-binding cassette domain-containing protein, partial [Anaerolineaceae bacterium]|nr:ATP-binding cassette domain-containing protein [Anaerolineaceae bacterium]